MSTRGNPTPGPTIEVTDHYGVAHVVPGPFSTLTKIKRANADSGRYWFSESTLQFFSSKFSQGLTVHHGRFFISSEQFVGSDGSKGQRLYTVRIAADDGSISDLGDFQQHGSVQSAVLAIKQAVADGFEAASKRAR